MSLEAGRSDPAPRTPRPAALAAYLRETAAAFSLSADVTDADVTAQAGMALLDAALIAEQLPEDSSAIETMSRAGLFESMPAGRALFVEVPEIRAVVHRPLVSDREDGPVIIAKLIETASALAAPAAGDGTGPGAPRPGAADGVPLRVFSEAVRSARSALHTLRQGRMPVVDRARHDLVLALEHYIGALERRNLPVPRQLNAELQLNRGLLRRWS